MVVIILQFQKNYSHKKEEDEAQIIRNLFTDFASGRLVTDILAELKEKQILCRGKHFARSTIYNYLRNEKYVGRHIHNGEVFTNIYPPIISEELFEFVKNKIENNKYGKHKPDVVYLLKNKLKCGYCGNIVKSESGTARSGKVFRYYKCTKKIFERNCECKPIRKDLIEELVVNTILTVLGTNEMIYRIAEKVIEFNKKKLQENATLNILNKEKDSIEKGISNILTAMEKGIITSSVKTHLEELEIKKQLIEEQIIIEKTKEKLELTIDDVYKYLKVAISKKPKQMIDLIVKEIKLYNDKIEIFFKYNKIKDKTCNKNEIVHTESKTIKPSSQAKKSQIDIEVFI